MKTTITNIQFCSTSENIYCCKSLLRNFEVSTSFDRLFKKCFIFMCSNLVAQNGRCVISPVHCGGHSMVAKFGILGSLKAWKCTTQDLLQDHIQDKLIPEKGWAPKIGSNQIVTSKDIFKNNEITGQNQYYENKSNKKMMPSSNANIFSARKTKFSEMGTFCQKNISSSQ